MVIKEVMANIKNIALVAFGALLVVIGFVCLGHGPANGSVSLTIAPVILVLAYLVVIPYGILRKSKNQSQKTGD